MTSNETIQFDDNLIAVDEHDVDYVISRLSYEEKHRRLKELYPDYTELANAIGYDGDGSDIEDGDLLATLDDRCYFLAFETLLYEIAVGNGNFDEEIAMFKKIN